METICPLSNSPCSGVLKFKLASNASANVASALSLDWVMDGKAFQWTGSQVYEIGWAAYLTRKWNRWRDRNPDGPASLPPIGFGPRERAEKKSLLPTCRARNADLDC